MRRRESWNVNSNCAPRLRPRIRGALNLISTTTDPTLKAQVWKLMKGIRSPDLIATLSATLRNEFDRELRLQAVIRLQEDFASDPAAVRRSRSSRVRTLALWYVPLHSARWVETRAGTNTC
jgi:hypothetical protein